MSKKHTIERKSEQKLIEELLVKENPSSQTIAKPRVSSSYFSTQDFYPVLGRKVEVVTYEGKKFKTEMLNMLMGLRFSISETSFDLLSIRDVKEWRYV